MRWVIDVPNYIVSALRPEATSTMHRVFRSALLAACLIGLGAIGAAAQPANPCGISPTDWCASPPGDRCGQHKNERDCRADPLCKGMPYRGESVIACIADGKGFWENCPAVGCISR